MYYFDVCGTLYGVNTTFSFIKYYHFKKRNWLKLFFVLFCLSLFGKILNRFIGVSIRTWLIATLKGVTYEDLQKVADDYLIEVLEEKKLFSVFSIFSTLVNKNPNDIVLVSASIDPVINAIARKYNVKWYSSKLEYINNVSTGRLASDLKGNKESVIEKYDTRLSVFYTDNIDDIPCAKLMKKLYFIVKKTKKLTLINFPDNVELINV